MKIAGVGLPDMAGAVRPDRRQRAGRLPVASAPAEPAAGTPFAVRARVTITPWTDLAFARDVRDVVRLVSLSDGVVLGTGSGAIVVERLLRERGYRRARVIDARTADEALRRVAHWEILRDGERAAADA